MYVIKFIILFIYKLRFTLISLYINNNGLMIVLMLNIDLELDIK